jgi:tetratricopeptide (TPR) repeat protein
MQKLAHYSLTLLLLGGCTSSMYYPPGTEPRVPVEEIGNGTPGTQPPAQAPAPPPGSSPVVVNPAIITTPPPRPAAPPPAAATPLDADITTAMQGGDFERAAALTERALRIRPRDATLWYNLASIRLNQGRAQEAEGHAQRALSFSTDPAQRNAIQSLLAQIQTQR